MEPKFIDNPSQFISALHSITIIKDEATYDVVSPETVGTGESKLLLLDFKESLGDPFMSGSVEFKDKDDWVGQLNIVGGETIIIRFGFIDLPYTQSPKELKFKIVSSKIINSFADINEIRTGIADKNIIYRMEFMAAEFFDKMFDSSFLNLDKDFIGYIALGNEEGEQSTTNQIPGLINELAGKLGISIKTESTKNGIWLKYKDISYPSGVNQGQIDLAALVKYVSSNAVSKINPNAVNFFFWQDRDGWYFKSIEKLLKEDSEQEESEKLTFDLNTDHLKGEKEKLTRVISVNVKNQNDLLNLKNSRAFYSHYMKQTPKYEDPYFDFMSSVEGYTYNIVDYDYHRDFSKIKHIEKHKLIPDDEETSSFINKAQKTTKPSRLVNDNVWGYYELNSLNFPFENGVHYSSDRGFGAKPENPKVVWWDYVDRKEDSRWSNITWQPQFDITQLEIKKLYDIHTKIRTPLEQKRKEFVKMKNLKRRWEVYRCVVCCFNGFDYGIKDKQQLEALKSIGSACGFTGNLGCISPSQLGISGDVYNFLFGENGIYKGKEEYRVVAAGSFTDLIDYDKKNECVQHGLSLAVDFNNLQFQVPPGVNGAEYKPNEWLNSTIGQFYNLKDQIPNYLNFVINRGLSQYDKEILNLQNKKSLAQVFLSKVQFYIIQADAWIESRLLPCCEPYPRNSTTPTNAQIITQSADSLCPSCGSECPTGCCNCGVCDLACDPDEGGGNQGNTSKQIIISVPIESIPDLPSDVGGITPLAFGGVNDPSYDGYNGPGLCDFSPTGCAGCRQDAPQSGFPTSQWSSGSIGDPGVKGCHYCFETEIATLPNGNTAERITGRGHWCCNAQFDICCPQQTIQASLRRVNDCKALLDDDSAGGWYLNSLSSPGFPGGPAAQYGPWGRCLSRSADIPVCINKQSFEYIPACVTPGGGLDDGIIKGSIAGDGIDDLCVTPYKFGWFWNTSTEPLDTPETCYQFYGGLFLPYCSLGGISATGTYDLCEEGTEACLRQGCTDPLTGSVFSREPSACVGFNYIDGLGEVPLIVLPKDEEGRQLCMKCNNFLENDADIEFDQLNCCNCTAAQAKTFVDFKTDSALGWCRECSKDKFMKTLAQYIGTEENWYFNYQYTPGGGSAFADIDDYIGPNGDPSATRRCLENGDCYNKLCFNPLYLEVEKRRAEQEIKIIDAEIKLLQYAKNLFANGLAQKFQQEYLTWWNRKAFFYSKLPGKNVFSDLSTGLPGSIQNGRLQPIVTDKSLFNIKSIKRKSIRGSRYELLARNRGITGAQVGSWLYNITFNGSDHPYYGQKYNTTSAFKTSRKFFQNYKVTNANTFNDFPFLSKYAPLCSTGIITDITYFSGPAAALSGQGPVTNVNPTIDFVPATSQTDLEALGPSINTPFRETFNLYNIQSNSIPPNLKREQLSSYVRIEFETPIGLESIQDFPDGFVRDAGTEYFLPYIVSLTAGPNGRQTIRNNAVVIGQDPYGFDVAIKKSKVEDEESTKTYGWWEEYNKNLNDTSLTNNGMDLWPEVGFETKFPYYVAEPKGWWWDNAWHHGENRVDVNREDVNSYDWYNGRSADVDPEYKESAHGSGYLQFSHRKIKPHRSWWSFHIPKNIFIPQELFHVLATKFGEIGGEKSGILGDILAYKYKQYNWWYPDELDRWLQLTQTGKNAIAGGLNILNTSQLNANDIIDVHSPALSGWFTSTTMNWAQGNSIVYRPTLVTQDVWKYDLTGESDYGMITPPTMNPNYDLFDNNFAAQFLVFSRSSKICEGFVCANPSGPVGDANCPPNNPYCNCPCQDKKPTQPEPSYLDLFCKWQELKECDLIKSVLGEEYLGCVWSDPNAPCSCICPCQNSKFKEYLEYNRTYATFWDTPERTPLNRLAQITQMGAQEMEIIVPFTTLPRLGKVVNVKHYGAISPSLPKQEKNTHGKWMITGINYRFYKDNNAVMILNLNRDTLERDPKFTTPNLEELYRGMNEMFGGG